MTKLEKLIFLFLIFFGQLPYLVTPAPTPGYIREYADLSSREKKVMDSIYDTMNQDKSITFLDVDITVNEFNHIVDAIDSTWFLYDGYAYKYMDYSEMNEDQRIYRLVIHPRKFKKCYDKNSKYKSIPEKWAKK